MSSFAVSVSKRPPLRLYGLSVRTDMSRIHVDAPNLWGQAFYPRMPEISGKKPDEYHGPSYGICVMLDERALDYWAAMPVREGRSAPEGMRHIDLPGGLYAGCPVPSLDLLGEAYAYLYGAWLQSHAEYAPNMQAPCFEYYDRRYHESGALEVHAPVLRR